MAENVREQHQRAQNEFTRQAESFESAPVLADDDLIGRLVRAAELTGTSRVLDLACGPGLLSERLVSEAAHVVPFDLTRAMLERLRARASEAGLGPFGLTRGAAEALPFRKSVFDAVVSRLALHHALDPRAVIHELARVLRPGGRAVIADIVTDEDPDKAELHNALERLRDPSHVRMLGRSELLSNVEAAGLEIVDVGEWSTPRRFSEWIAIANAPERIGPLASVMRSLARAGLDCGVDLHVDGEEPAFCHHWVLVTACRGELTV